MVFGTCVCVCGVFGVCGCVCVYTHGIFLAPETHRKVLRAPTPLPAAPEEMLLSLSASIRFVFSTTSLEHY